VYGSFALSGASGPGSTDTPGDDAGESPFLRGIINLQDFTADDMKNRWGDNGLDQLTTTSDWDPNNKFFRYLYNRVYYTVPQCNLLINQVNQYDISNKEQVKSELRFLRSLAYFYLIDCFGKGVLLRETDPVSSSPKPESSRIELFNFVESELLDIEGKLPNRISYGRANKNVVRMLLAKLYLNAEVYTGIPQYDKALTYCEKIINEGGYQLAPNFVSLFSGDNDISSAKDEIIYALIADPLNSQSYGNTTYLVNGSLNADTMIINDFGASEGWAGHRATKAWYGKFKNASGSFISNAEELANAPDDRAKLFWSNYLSSDPTKIHNFEMNDYKKWIDGFPSTKFRNSNFLSISSPVPFSNTDFPLYRL
ncbi:MAG: RagB/SusD family nutrient uptake outer membrane protein, partial [Bacteroidota bacterium]